MFDDATLSISRVLRTLHKERRADRIAHLRSIDHDANFVAGAHAALGKPALLANLRCGVWYVDQALSAGNCYFKSTDGHAGGWAFSLSRINMQVALAASAHGGAMVVDSTRSGKRFPDSLSKTVPIWCCVVNRACAELSADRRADWDTDLHLPPWVPPSEASQIEARIGGWVAALRRPAMAAVLAGFARALDAPLRPGWLCPPPPPDGGCAVAAAATEGAVAAERSSYTYVQGAADDEENWARGLRGVALFAVG
ncbi:hypothetical protein EMIHUDRAFT_449651 [Emiliania huxleyi CCMP1516]|uniref:Rit1 N-terminal domain-containing protein n=2 Tax=Emiliania huxleyi TaxID=2903 RepID=A0A0D3K5M9_EMIH1|nr:hypothetical protein EMIHUDRAFT_449651 [Emiliania huxleyi CCMP1516]EOD31064.1 hypothetical protein EMIHUDRAFT_449651 [Emiliania huxleyi CCMP1516]|eukprot:XP_005783493.1 hypothetical protein EMIHUDRAFT_449651 [Emiliania huxleyi CCMP1516]